MIVLSVGLALGSAAYLPPYLYTQHLILALPSTSSRSQSQIDLLLSLFIVVCAHLGHDALTVPRYLLWRLCGSLLEEK